MNPSRALSPLLILALAACGTSTSGDASLPADSAVPGDAAQPVDATAIATIDMTPSCVTTSTSTLPDVAIQFPNPVCTFSLAQAAAGIHIPYSVVISSDVAAVTPAASPMRNCEAPGPSGLILYEQIAGSGQSYCDCDNGRCLPPAMTTVTLKMGTYPGTFTWDGKNWNGPSDTGVAEGAAFPPGSYVLTERAIGGFKGAPGDKFTVEGTLTITLTP